MDALIDSYYEASVVRDAPSPPLCESVAADVCVIGGGYTGVSAALHLCERGYKVVLLEANRVGWGASGRNGGQINVGFSGDLNAAAGGDKAKAQALFDISREGLALIRERVAKHKIECDLKSGVMLAAVKPRQARALAGYADELCRRGYPVELFTDAAAVRGLINSKRYCAAMLDKNGGHIHPLKYLLGLTRAAAAAGAHIYEDSRVVGISPDGGKTSLIKTARGEVKARYVALACNAYLDELQPRLRRRIMPVGTYICATAPLGEDGAGSLIANGAAVCDMNFVLDYYRCSADARLLFGGRVSYTTVPPRDLRSAMRRRMLAVFPQLGDVAVDYAWGGFVAITRSRLPDFGRVAGGGYYAQGFSGQGVAMSGLAGKLIAEAVDGAAARFDMMADIRHRDFPGGRAARAPLLAMAMLYYRARDLW
jgi:gamma-glutamylputrescine oxidase